MDKESEIERMQRQRRGWQRAITISVLAIIASGILFLVSPFNPFRDARTVSPGSACLANLRNIDSAKAVWALENRKSKTMVPTDAELYGATNYLAAKPQCPKGGTYITGRVDRKPRCTFPGHTL